MPTFIRIRGSPAKAAINSDRAIAEKLTGAWLPCQESSAPQWPAQSNYRLKAEDVFKLQNNVRYRSKADMRGGASNVRYYPYSRHRWVRHSTPVKNRGQNYPLQS